MGGVIPGVTPIPTTAARCASHRRAASPLALAWTSGSNGVAGKLGCKRLSAAIGPSLLALEQLEGMMIVLRFRGQCQPDKLEEALAAFRAVVAPSRELDGVISFDVPGRHRSQHRDRRRSVRGSRRVRSRERATAGRARHGAPPEYARSRPGGNGVPRVILGIAALIASHQPAPESMPSGIETPSGPLRP